MVPGHTTLEKRPWSRDREHVECGGPTQGSRMLADEGHTQASLDSGQGGLPPGLHISLVP